MTSALPTWLSTPPTTEVQPPRVTRAQKLPFTDLEWPDFEKLCLRLVQADSDIEECRTYGVPGDAQEGIDLYAIARSSGAYAAYQCKRVRGFGAARIRNAVDEFLAGDWSGRATTFCLCTMESMAARHRADALVKQRELLRSRGVRLEVWDEEALSTRLKSAPDVVDDFFGREWVRVFNGDAAAAALASRLAKGDMSALRKRLARLYFHMFTVHDPSFAFQDPAGVNEQDFVMPDIITQDRAEPAESFGRHPRETRRIAPAGLDPDELVPALAVEHAAGVVFDRRDTADAWLSTSNGALVLGGPGSGKSTLLRLIALDLLSARPRLERLAQAWGTLLPVWIPFARWTALQHERAAQLSLLDFVKDWIVLQSEPELLPLVECALNDGRILLLVDGIDEWSNPDAARAVFDLLVTFARQRNIPAVLTGRPQALQELGAPANDWRVGRVAPLTEQQQGRIATIALASEKTGGPGGVVSVAHARSSEQFLRDVRRKTELLALTQTPLLLTLLVQLWHRNADLPEDRFKAYAGLAHQLLIDHPARRRRAAFVTTQSHGLPEDVLGQALSALALEIHARGSGSLERSEAVRVLEGFLQDSDTGPGYTRRDASGAAHEVLRFAADSAGLLVASSPTHVAFYHRCLQDFFSAEAISRRPLRERIQTAVELSLDVRAHEVVLALAASTRSVEETESLVTSIRAVPREGVQSVLATPLLAELAFAPNCPAKLRRDIIADALTYIEQGAYDPVREELLPIVLRGLRHGALEGLVGASIERWLPRRCTYRASLYSAIGEWPESPEAVEALIRGLFEERTSEAQAAARALVKRAGDDPDLRQRLVRLLYDAPLIGARAALAGALIDSGYVDDVARYEAAVGARREFALLSIKCRVASGSADESDLDTLLELSEWSSGLDREWEEQIPSLLVQGWPESKRLRDLCKKSLLDMGRGHLKPELARSVLIRGFSADAEVAKLLAAEITARGPLTYDRWPLYVEFCRGNRDIVAAADDWLLSNKHDVVEGYYAAMVSRSERAKEKMLSWLDRPFPHWAAKALLDGWGMGDPRVARALGEFASGSRASEVAFLLPSIVPDRRECRTRLLQVLRGKDCARVDFVSRGLGEVRGESPEPEVVSDLLEAMERETAGLSSTRASIIANWADDPRVHRIALDQLEVMTGEVGAVAVAGKRIAGLREPLLRVIGVLPSPLRATLAGCLGDLADEPFAGRVLARYRLETDASVRSACATSYLSTRSPRPGGTAEVVADLHFTGFHMDEVREAAFTTLLALGEVSQFKNAVASPSEPDPLCLRPGLSWRFNAALWRCIASNWVNLTRAVEDPVARLCGGDAHSSKEFWNLLSCFARKGSDAASAIVGYARGRPEQEVLPTNVLRFLEQEMGASAVLREACIAAIKTSRRPHPFGEVFDLHGLAAAEILGRSFRSDAEVLSLIALRPPAERLWTLPVVAMCTGWRDSEQLESVFHWARSTRPPTSEVAYAALVSTKGSVEGVCNVVGYLAGQAQRSRDMDVACMARFTVRRLREDDEAYAAVAQMLEDTSRDEHSQAFLWLLLAHARSLTPKLRALGEQALSAEHGIPVLVNDPLTGRLRVIKDLVLDVFSGER